ncbi:MAG: hypothetical protein ACXV5F_05895 [Halobacteriota archaeon]
MPACVFSFYRTFLPILSELDDAVVLSFDNTTFLRVYGANVQAMPEHFVHSGNFFSLPYSKKPELRTKERVLALQERLVNAKTNGLMTLNVPVSYDLKTPIWQYETKDRLRALEEGLKAALWAKERAKHPDLLYAGFEIGTYDDAAYIFNKAFDAGLARFAAGFGLYSRFIKFRKEDKLKQFEVLAAFNHVLSERCTIKLHVSGGSALNTLELLAYANVSSADGSSAVLAGLAYGSVLTASGGAIRANTLKEWKCDCEFCSGMNKHTALEQLRSSPEARVRHNIRLVRRSEARINKALRENTMTELTERRLKEYDKKELWRCYTMVRKSKSRT